MVRWSSRTDSAVTTLAPYRSASDDARDRPAIALPHALRDVEAANQLTRAGH
jgi:hypothetical protein